MPQASASQQHHARERALHERATQILGEWASDVMKLRSAALIIARLELRVAALERGEKKGK
ncbi:MAG: hypothetical protein OET63_04895 [Desulfobacterales bacterium]|nr:hypothetical protein [Desulfobacterales bacterium]